MNFLKKNLNGILVCFVIAVPSWLLGKTFPVVGGPVIAILAGMLITLVWTNKGKAESGIKWTSKIILQTAVVLLGFGMNLGVILQTGKQSLPIIVCTISTSLIIAWLLRKIIKVPSNTSILVGVGSSICGGSAIAATAPVIDADDTEVAQAISVIFFFNVIAAVLFPVLGNALGFDTTSGNAFGVFAGTAINDTSSVTAAASTWDSMWNLGSETLNTAVTVKLTRTLAIIPITLVLSFFKLRKNKDGQKINLKKVFPFFIIYFVLASIITTVAITQLFRSMYSTEPMGLLNQILQKVGLGGMVTSWLAKVSTVLPAVSIPEGWRFTGMYMVIFYAALVSLDPSVYEAAKIDGASEMQILFKIKMPLIKDIILLTLTMCLTGALRGFDIPFLLTSGGPGNASELMSTYMYKKAFSSNQYGYGSTLAVFIIIESILVVYILRKIFTSKEQKEEKRIEKERIRRNRRGNH